PDLLAQAGLAVGRIDSKYRPGLDLPVRADDYRMLTGLIAWDRLDDRDLPTSGVALALRGERALRSLGASGEHWRLLAEGPAAGSASVWRGAPPLRPSRWRPAWTRKATPPSTCRWGGGEARAATVTAFVKSR